MALVPCAVCRQPFYASCHDASCIDAVCPICEYGVSPSAGEPAATAAPQESGNGESVTAQSRAAGPTLCSHTK